MITGDLFDFVRELKQADGGDISVCGSISVVRQVFLAGLLDELTLVIHPVGRAAVAGPCSSRTARPRG